MSVIINNDRELPTLSGRIAKMTIVRNLKSHLNNSVAKLRQNEDGLAAIEFAILAPIMVSMYFGLAEIASAIAVDRSISHATNVAGDLTSQVANVDETDLEDLLTATLRIMDVDSTSKVSISLESWSRDAGGNNTLVGSATMNAGAANLPAFNVATVDSTLLNETAGVVVARVAYLYSPLKLQYMNTDFTMSDTFILKPRRSSEVTFGNTDGKTYTCSSSGSSVSCS
jgi:Flp pilus assembly protein TadG